MKGDEVVLFMVWNGGGERDKPKELVGVIRKVEVEVEVEADNVWRGC